MFSKNVFSNKCPRCHVCILCSLESRHCCHAWLITIKSNAMCKFLQGLQLNSRHHHHHHVHCADIRCKCSTLYAALPNITYSRTEHANLYQQSVESYFSVQDRLTPTCFIKPSNTQDVSNIVGLLSKNSCQFAFRSGGHGLLVGSSNIVTGVTIDLSSMNSVALSADKQTASVQPGAKWIQVYETLDPLGYAIPGGRAGDVGVGGLTSGGECTRSASLVDS